MGRARVPDELRGTRPPVEEAEAVLPRPPSLLPHALALLAVVVVGLLWVGEGAFSADEGAAIIQAEHLADGDGWRMAHPFPEADPEGEAYPLELGLIGEDGIAPFGKHPLYASMLAIGDRLGGWYGMVLWSSLATVGAALLAARLTLRLDASLAVVVLWATGLGTPLLFDGYLLIAHSLSAALGAAMALLLLRWLDDSPAALVGLGVCAALAAMVRTEALLFVGALGVAAVFAARRRRDGVVAALVAGGGAVAGYVANEVWQRAIVGGGGPANPPSGVRGGSFLSDRVEAFVTTWLRPHYSTEGSATFLLIVGVLLLAVAVGALRSARGRLAGGTAVAGGVAVALGVLLAPGAPIPGLLIACPLVVVGLVAADRLPWDRVEVRLLGSTVGLFFVAVLATQYRSGGSGEWGGRYFAMALPLVVPLAVMGLQGLLAGVRADDRRAVVAGVVVATGALALGSVLTMHRYHDRQQEFSATLAELSAVDPGDGGAPVVVTTAGYAPRMSWDSYDDRRWLLVDRSDDSYAPGLVELATRLEDLGIERWTLVTGISDEEGPAALAEVVAVGPAAQDLEDGGWSVFPVGS